VINSAADATKRFTQLSSSIFRTDREAIKKLIGRTQDGGSLTNFFKRLDQPVREASKKALIEGFSKGEGADEIARRLRDAADIGRSRALTIARTETNEAYRAASREFLSGSGEIKKYVWLAVLDTRTCLICWALHGRHSTAIVKSPLIRIAAAPSFLSLGTRADRDRPREICQATVRISKTDPRRKAIRPLHERPADRYVCRKLKSDEFGLRHFIKPLDRS
jgi:SPP1 gp7 family putative phage head morphogenesis protein